MRTHLSLPIALLAAACATGAPDPDSLDPMAHILVEGTVSDDMDADAAVADFAASGAMYGVVVDARTGDTLTLQNQRRTVNSSDYTLLAACPDCVGNCATLDRQVRFDLFKLGGGPVAGFDVQTISASNYTFDTAESECAINGNGFTGHTFGTCPNLIGTTTGDQNAIVHYGTVTSCGPFSYYFDTTDGL